MTEADIECGHAKTTLHARGVNRSRKIITFSQLNSTDVNDNFMRKKSYINVGCINPIICVICVFPSSSRLGTLSGCFLMTSFTSLSIASLVCNAASKLN